MEKKKILLVSLILCFTTSLLAQNGFVSFSFGGDNATTFGAVGQNFSRGVSLDGYVNEGIYQSFLYRGADTLLQENSTYPSVYRTKDRNPENVDYIVAQGLTPDSLYLLPTTGDDSLVSVMAYGVTFVDDTIVVAPYSKQFFAFNIYEPLILPEGSVPPVKVNNNVVPEFVVGETTPVTWKFNVSKHELIDTQYVKVLFPPCGNDNFTVAYNHSAPYVVITPVGESFQAEDYEQNKYESARIGYYCWTKENLKSKNYADGAEIKNPLKYQSPLYPNASQNFAQYGFLYNWNDALRCEDVAQLQLQYNDTLPNGFVQGACPEGWRVPSVDEMRYLQQFSSDQLMSSDLWLNGNGNNMTDFTALPGGYFSGVNYENLLGEADFWTSTALSNVAYFAVLKSTCPDFLMNKGAFKSGKSVRCLKN